MSAHLRPLRRCDTALCGNAATQELHNSVNAPCGRYCDRHAKQALAAWKRAYEAEGTDR